MEYLGGIPKLPTQGTSTVSSRFDISLRKMARWSILKIRARSFCQTLARYAKGWNPADYTQNAFLPSVSNEINLLHGVRPDCGPLISDYRALIETFGEMIRDDGRRMGGLFAYRADLERYFCDHMVVSREKWSLMRFLSFHVIDFLWSS